MDGVNSDDTKEESSGGLRREWIPVSSGWSSFSGCPVGCSALYIPAAAPDQWSQMGDILSCVFLYSFCPCCICVEEGKDLFKVKVIERESRC